jgi:CRP-like cAMP-binding protein
MSARVNPSRSADFALKRLAALAPLDAEDERLLQDAAGAARHIPARKDIVREGDPIGQGFILLDGWAYRARILSDGRRQILHFLLPGDMIGLCFHLRPAALTTITALTDVVLCPAPVANAEQGGEGLAAAYALSRALEEEHLLRQITRLGRLSAYERITDWLLETGERLARAGAGEEDQFQLPVTQEAMADMLGLTSVHVNRTLQAMWRDGLLRIQGGKVTILDRSRCEQLADHARPASFGSSFAQH